VERQLSGLACGAQIEGSTDAPAGTTVYVFTQEAATRYEAARDSAQRARVLADSATLSQGRDPNSERFNAQIAGRVEPEVPRPVPLATGSVGQGGELIFNGRVRGDIAFVIEYRAPDKEWGCRVDAHAPWAGTVRGAMIGSQCKPWLLFLSP